MNKEFERYNIKVEIPITVILETIFSSDNKDVETLCRWALKYGFVDLIDNDKVKYYKLQDDYEKQSFYTYLSKQERKQYDYENYLCDEIEKKDKKFEAYENMRKEAYNTLTKSKEYVMALAMELNEKQSVLIQLANILNKVGGSDE